MFPPQYRRGHGGGPLQQRRGGVLLQRFPQRQLQTRRRGRRLRGRHGWVEPLGTPPPLRRANRARVLACPTGGGAEVESAQNKRQLCGGSQAAIERMIHFGRELQSMSEHLRRECGKNSANKKMLKVGRTRRGRGRSQRWLMWALGCRRTPSACWPTPTPGAAPSDTSWTPSRGSRSAPPSTVQY